MTKSTTIEAMHVRRRAFLEALAISGVVTSACESAGVSRKAAYHWRDSDEAFRDEWDEAIATATDRLEAEARRRAVDGVEVPIMHRGQVVFRRGADGEVMRDSAGEPIPLTTFQRSDRLLEVMLAAKRSEQYGRKTVDVNQRVERKPAAAPVNASLESLPLDARRRVLDMMEKIEAELRAAPVPLAAPSPVGDGFEDEF